ncbi:dynamin family protein [Streptomyces sp. B1866]|uniref:dynamin family protein n=1 Tax=Streptomyces sp. B1866 TaxID=3075431 RepID=UPI0028910E7D|nr:dynamin family protein [Streptomyces sp. B1866]MDT3396028.1 dynamin family protein [Streptomyces sp. B1866]
MLRRRVEAAFARAEALLPRAEFPRARRRLDEIRAGLDARLRVAVVGRVSAGKSTLVNALLGEDRAPTGVTELTFNVTRLHHAPRETLTVHYRDGRPSGPADPARLRELAARAHDDPDRLAELRAVDWLDMGSPNAWLARFDLVDTPGLDSYAGEDSARTLRFLGRTGRDVHTATVEHASRADALVMVFASGLARSEELLLAETAGAGVAAGPLTAVGALTKTELYWPACPDPMAEGRRVADRIMAAAGGRRVLFELRPLAGLLAAGAAACTDQDVADLTVLSRTAPEALEARVRRGPLFASRPYPDLPVPAERRAGLLRRFGGWGLVLACGLVRDGLTGREALRDELLRRSGVAGFRDLLTEHFGNRADVVKLDAALREARGLADLAGPDGDPRTRWRLREAAGAVTGLAVAEHAFRELALLRAAYDGAVPLTPPELAEVLRVTGEHGLAPAARLGLPPGAPRPGLTARAAERQAYWAAVDLDPARGPAVAEAARVVRRSYDLLLDRIDRQLPVPDGADGADWMDGAGR